MNINDTILDIKIIAEKNRALMQGLAFQNTIAWLHYLGLLRHNKIPPRRCYVELRDALEAGKLEPRIFELLPAIMVVLPHAFTYTPEDIPDDLVAAMKCLKKEGEAIDFRGMPIEKCRHWMTAPIMEIAGRRMNYRRIPRQQKKKSNTIGEVIRQGRMALAMTQRQLAETYDISLRVLRDLEQGKMDASMKAVNKILEIFGRRLRV